MKKLITFSLVVLLSWTASSQDLFKVINVNGEIFANKANANLESGIEVASDDEFDFIAPNSRAAMINSELGRVILTEQNSEDAFARAAFAPAMTSISTRGTAVASTAELQHLFTGNMIIIDRLELKINSQYYPMDDKNFFYINYIYENEPVNKRLSFKNDIMIVDKAELFSIDGNPIDHSGVENLKLFYYVKQNIPESTLIAEFDMGFVDGEQIKPEVQIIVQELNEKPFDVIITEVHEYLKAFYGVAVRTNLESWLDSEFNVKND